MPLLLRKVRENRWYKSEAERWLQQGDVPADLLGDLRTQQNQLSVYEVLPDRSNLERIVRALALGTNSGLADTGWVMFDSDMLAAVGIGTSASEPGDTQDKQVNQWHRDLVELSGNRLVALTKLILIHGESGTVLKKRLRELVEMGINAKELPEKLRPKLGPAT